MGAAAQAAAADPARVAALVVEQTNALRHEQGLAPVAAEPRLTRTAAAFAAYMADADRYGHEADGRTPSQRATRHGYAFCSIAENIAFLFHSAGYETPALARGFVTGWRDSPPHRRNMLQPDVTETGVAVARSANSGRYYAVQLFARPAALRMRFSVANAARQPVAYALDGTPHELPPGATRTHTQCTGGAIAMQLPGEAQALRVQAADGGRYVVGGGPGQWRLDGAR